MMRLKKYLILFLTIPIFSGCTSWFGPDEVVVSVPKIIDKKIPKATHPKPIKLAKIKFHVVTDDNIKNFRKEFVAKNGEYVFVALSIKDYENLSLNVAQINQYILQMKDIIIYYEKSIDNNYTSDKLKP